MKRGGAAILLIMLFAAEANAANGFIKFDGVDGEAKDKAHKQWIDVVSVAWPAAPAYSGDPDRPLVTGAVGAPPSGPGKLTVTARSDAAAAQLERAAQQRRRFSRVVLEMPDANGRATRYELRGVTIVAARSETGRQTEQLTLNYEKISLAPSAGAVGAPVRATPPARAQ